MRQPIAENEQIDRWLMRQHLAPETLRVVSAVWWGVYSVTEAIRELRGQAFLIAKRNRVEPDIADAVAVNAFDEEMQRQEQEHETSIEAMRQAAFIALRQGADLSAARKVVAQTARDRPLMPTREMMTHALERAAQDLRRAEKWWAARETAK